MMKNILHEKTGASGPVETILLFSISFISLGLILMTFQSLNDRQTETVMQEELIAIGNNIAKSMEDITIEERASTGMGSSIKAELNLPGRAANNQYSVKLTTGRITLESLTGPHVTVEVPMNTDIVVAENSTIYSTDEILELQYDSRSSTVYFTNGGVEPVPDTSPPNITIVSPPASPAINNTVTITVSVSDNKGVTQVEYNVSGTKSTVSTSPYSLAWNTKTVPNGTHIIEATAYDAAGYSNRTSITYIVTNSATNPPVITIVRPGISETTNFTRPIINVTISDDVGINFSTLIMTIDGTPVTPDHTSGNPSTVTYAVPANMNVGSHFVNVSVNDTDPMGVQGNSTSRSFTIEAPTPPDSSYPTALITFPILNSDLVPGSAISAGYSVSDPVSGSGLDNFTITVRRNDGWNVSWYHEVSSYPDNILSTSSGQYSFTDTYVSGYTYNYTIKVYDRSGKSNTSTVGPFLAGLGQSAYFVVDITNNKTNGKQLTDISLMNNGTGVVSIKDIIVSWSGGGVIKNIQIQPNSDIWTGSASSGALISVSHTVPTTAEKMTFIFDFNPGSNTFTIAFHLSDTSYRTVTFKAKS